ncbi:hypothetical protein GCM10027600_24570 [Nocardioides ginsengisegetis]
MHTHARCRRPVSLRTRGAVASALLVLAAGCSSGGGDVEVDGPSLGADDAAACDRLVAALPDTLAEQDRRTVTPADAPGAAWGDPAITLTCGVDVPKGFDEFSSCEVANGVGWYVDPATIDDQSADVTLTAVGYRPIVRVEVPADYRPSGSAAVIAELAGPVRRSLELVKPCH